MVGTNREIAVPPVVRNEIAAQEEIRSRETENLVVLASHQIVWRVGWTFKTESIILPAILDTVAGAGWLRGCLPLLGRLGQSVPPLFAVGVFRAAARKKWTLMAFAALAGLPYLALAGIWSGAGGEKRGWMAAVILALHFAFFVCYGLYQIAFGTVQGKLIRPERRGQLLWGATFVGLFPTVVFCQWLMPDWLMKPMPGFTYLFLFVGLALVLAAILVGALAEPAGNGVPRLAERSGSVAEILQALRRDRNLRRLVFVILLACLGLVTIPHYQAFARDRLGLDRGDLVFMVITHTTSVSVYSLLIGPVADRWGNRLTLRLLILGAAIAPVYVLCLPSLAGSLSRNLFWLVFVPLALTPLVPTILINYALEICRSEEHPRYVSIVNLAMMPPFLLSPLMGMLVDAISFEAVAGGTAVLMLLCGLMTFWLDEPRSACRRSSCEG
jgi:Major Facilitator Superfamily